MKVKDLLSSREKWTQGVAAKNRSGLMVHPSSPDAVSWCLFGAIMRCYSSHDQMKADEKLQTAFENSGIAPSIVEFNDAPNRTFEEILNMVELADI